MEADIKRMERDIEQRTLKRIDVVDRMIKSASFESSNESLGKVAILGYGQVPSFPREARKGFKLMVALVLSLIASFVVAIFVEGLDHSVRRREEIEEQLNVPYLGSLSTHYL
jgi:capsular polysaccharide biosynthesis protein